MTITKIIHVVNRSLFQLEVMDDGIAWPLRPGYKQLEDGSIVGAAPNGDVVMEPLPYYAAERAIRQNPVMGTEDPYNSLAFESYIAVPSWGQDYSYRAESEAIERLDRSQLADEDAQKAKTIIGRGRRTGKKVRDPQTGRFRTVDPNTRSVLGPITTINPAGIETRVDG